jgi:hypothetical protein
MKTITGAMMLLACMPLAMAKGHEDYPKEKIAAYVVEKVNVKVLPSALRPKLEKGKQTFADYGYVTSKIGANEAIVEAPNGGPRISLSVLQEDKSGIYVCLNGNAQNQATGRIQRVLLLKSKDSDSLLKGTESSKAFSGCPVIGATNQDADSSNY